MGDKEVKDTTMEAMAVQVVEEDLAAEGLMEATAQPPMELLGKDSMRQQDVLLIISYIREEEHPVLRDILYIREDLVEVQIRVVDI